VKKLEYSKESDSEEEKDEEEQAYEFNESAVDYMIRKMTNIYVV
jgi:hypothetical protein